MTRAARRRSPREWFARDCGRARAAAARRGARARHRRGSRARCGSPRWRRTAARRGSRLARVPRHDPAQRRHVRPGRRTSTRTSPTACTSAPTSSCGHRGDVGRGAAARRRGGRRPRARARAPGRRHPIATWPAARPGSRSRSACRSRERRRSARAAVLRSRCRRRPSSREPVRARASAAPAGERRSRGGSGSRGTPVSPYRRHRVARLADRRAAAPTRSAHGEVHDEGARRTPR